MKIEDIKQRLASQDSAARMQMNEALRIAPHELDHINEGREASPEAVEKLSDWFKGNYAQTYKQTGYTVAKLQGGNTQPPMARPVRFTRPDSEYDPTTGNPTVTGEVVGKANKNKPKLGLLQRVEVAIPLNIPLTPSV